MKTSIFKDGSVLLMMIIFIITSTSCYQKFYKVADNSGARTIDSSLLSKPDKYYILRAGSYAFSMNNIVLNGDNQSLTFRLEKVENIHTAYLFAKKESALKYKASKGEDAVLNEVHIYIPSDSNLNYGNTYTLDFNKIIQIENIEKDKKKTSNSTIMSTIGITVGTAAVIFGGLLIAFASSGYGF